jgi:hypothetical protein
VAEGTVPRNGKRADRGSSLLLFILGILDGRDYCELIDIIIERFFNI